MDNFPSKILYREDAANDNKDDVAVNTNTESNKPVLLYPKNPDKNLPPEINRILSIKKRLRKRIPIDTNNYIPEITATIDNQQDEILLVVLKNLFSTNPKENFDLILEFIVIKDCTQLNLEGFVIGTNKAKKLAQILPYTNLTSVNLDTNDIRAEGAEALAANLHQTSITSLNLGANYLCDKGIKALAQALPHPALKELYLYTNKMTSEGIIALAETLPQSNLEVLDLRGNPIGINGILTLIKILPRTKIKQLKFHNGETEVIQALISTLPHTQITELELMGYNISKEDKERLKAPELQHIKITL